MSKKKKKKGKKFTGEVTKTRVVKIFLALGFKTADKWDVFRLQKKIQNLPDLIEGAEFTDKMQKRVDRILNFLSQGQKIIVVDVEDATADDKRKQEIKNAAERETKRKIEKKAKDKSKVKTKAKKADKKDERKRQAKKAVASKEKKPGIIMSVLEFIKSGQPISEKQILTKLKQRFPDKNPESMERTIPQIPGHLRKHKDIDIIGKNDKGQYIIKKK